MVVDSSLCIFHTKDSRSLAHGCDGADPVQTVLAESLQIPGSIMLLDNNVSQLVNALFHESPTPGTLDPGPICIMMGCTP